jgi:hypothetical protein
VVDGHQRIYSIVRYLDNQFPLSGLRISQEFKGNRFHKLPAREQRFLRTRSLRAIVISNDSSPTMKFEVFERLNTGGVALNAQEIRNAIYRGEYNDLLQRMEQDATFRLCIGTKLPRRRMVDRELVLRFTSMREDLASYRTPLARFLNDHMREHRDADATWLEDIEANFRSTIERVFAALGAGAFRVLDPRTGNPERNVNRALFDAEMIVFSYVREDAEAMADRSGHVIDHLRRAFAEEDFEDSISRATGDRSRIRTRLKRVKSALSSAGLDIDPALDAAIDSLAARV